MSRTRIVAVGLFSLFAGVLFMNRVQCADIPLAQLPRVVVPSLYDLSLTIDPQKENFEGSVTITAQVNEPLSSFWIHGQNLKVTHSQVHLQDGSVIPVKYVQDSEEAKKNGVAQIQLGKTLSPQKIEIQFSWSAPFDESLMGLYRVKKEGRFYAYTQFEPTAARKVFPSFDEPSFKARFNISLNVPSGMEAITSTLQKSLKEEDGVRKLTFNQTEILPTYLIAFAVGEMDIVEAKDIPANIFRSYSVPLRGIAPKGKGKEIKKALERTAAYVDFLEGYFRIGYPFEKIDIIAVPDFSYGAMENVGAITFREDLVLINENTSIARSRLAAMVIAHELAHQWFGNLVTMKWWDNLWLNEAFANWMGYRVLERVNPEMKMDQDFLDSLHHTIPTDYSPQEKPVQMPIKRNDDIFQSVRGIIYEKGGQILSMFENFLGEENFRKGLQNYFSQYRFKNADETDFFESLASTVGKLEVVDGMKSFVFQPGIPQVDLDVSCTPEGTVVSASQTRYFPLGLEAVHKKEDLWGIPLCFKYSEGGQAAREECHYLKEKEAKFSFQSENCVDWIFPDTRAKGYYRWFLPQAELVKIPVETLTSNEQMAFFDNVKANFERGDLDFATVFQSTRSLAQSESYFVAQKPLQLLNWADEILDSSSQRRLAEVSEELYWPTYQKLKSQKGRLTEDEILLQNEVLATLAHLSKNPEVRKELNSKALKYLGIEQGEVQNGAKINAQALSPGLVTAAVRVALQEGQQGENGENPVFDQILTQLWANMDQPAIAEKLIPSFSKAPMPLLGRVQQVFFENEDQWKKQYRRLFLKTLFKHRKGKEASWVWFKTHVDQIVKLTPERRVQTIPTWMLPEFVGTSLGPEMKEFFETHSVFKPYAITSGWDSLQQAEAVRKKQMAGAIEFFQSKAK